MKYLMTLPLLLALAACGADGDPIRPSMSTTIGIGDSGIHGSTSVSATKGNVSVTVGL